MSETWDCFFFNDELDLLEARLVELGDFVDHFVLVEGDLTYSGAPKQLVFQANQERFRRWADKIVHVVAHLDPGSKSAWDRENQQRAILGKHLRDRTAEEDLILLGDVDEIPDRDAFGFLRAQDGPPVRLRMDHAVYFANWLLPQRWSNSTLAFRPSQFHEPTVRLQLGDSHRDWHGFRELQLDDAGVHVSFLGGVASIRAKVGAYAHREFDDDRFNGSPHLERCIEYGVHFQGREALRRLTHDELSPLLRRLSSRPESAEFFNFAPRPLSGFRTRAYCGYTWLRTRSRMIPWRILHAIDRNPSVVTGPGSPAFWAVDAALRLRRRLRTSPDGPLAAEFAGNLVRPPKIVRWR